MRAYTDLKALQKCRDSTVGTSTAKLRSRSEVSACMCLDQSLKPRMA